MSLINRKPFRRRVKAHQESVLRIEPSDADPQSECGGRGTTKVGNETANINMVRKKLTGRKRISAQQTGMDSAMPQGVCCRISGLTIVDDHVLWWSDWRNDIIMYG